jgi:hypothetical protein
MFSAERVKTRVDKSSSGRTSVTAGPGHDHVSQLNIIVQISAVFAAPGAGIAVIRRPTGYDAAIACISAIGLPEIPRRALARIVGQCLNGESERNNQGRCNER